MAFLQTLEELKLNNERYTTDTEGSIDFDNRLYNVESIAVNGGVQTNRTRRLPSLANITLRRVTKEQLVALETLNDAAEKFAVTFTIAAEGGAVTYSGTARIEGELVYNQLASTLTLNLMSADGEKFVEI
jgi:hypothetical protein